MYLYWMDKVSLDGKNSKERKKLFYNQEGKNKDIIEIVIKNRWDNHVLFRYSKENNTIKDTLLEAIKNNVNLKNVDLSRADLNNVDLNWINLSGANLHDIDLSGAVIGYNRNEYGYGDYTEEVKNLEKNSNISNIEIYENHNSFSSFNGSFWENLLIIHKYKINQKSKEMTLKEICKELGYNVKIVND